MYLQRRGLNAPVFITSARSPASSPGSTLVSRTRAASPFPIRGEGSTISDSKMRIDALTAAIEEFTANSARLNTEIGNLNKEISKNQNALDMATALRAKNNAEFLAEEKDMLQSIGSMKAAVIALSKHNEGAAPLQSEVSDSELIDIITKVDYQMQKHAALLSEKITPKQLDALNAFVQEGGSQGYAPQGGEIFGILQAMKES